MFKLIFKIIKKLVFSCFLIFGFNTISQSLNLIIPLNIYTTGVLSILGIPAFLGLIFIKIFIY